MGVPSWFEVAGAVLAVLAVGVMGWSLRGGRRVPAWSSPALGGLAGLGVTAFWGARAGALPVGWWVLGLLAGGALGTLPSVVGAWASRRDDVRVGDYAVSGVLGTGASGTVYRGRDPQGVAVAIKVLAPEWMADAEFRARFRAEAALMTHLDHPNCVRVYDVLDDEVIAAIVTELVDGASLRAVRERSGPLESGPALAVLQGALSGLSYLHARGIVHRDVKPENILVDRRGVSKLVDFGLARRVGERGASGEESVGSPRYMSPEQAQGRLVDVRSDVYSCGVLLFELLTNRPPFTAGQVSGLLRAHVEDPVPDPREIRAETPAALAELCMQAMAKDPADRPATAAEFLESLARAAESSLGTSWSTGPAVLGLAAIVGAVAGVAGSGAVGAGGLAAAAAGLAPLASPTVAASSTVAQVVSGPATPAAPAPAGAAGGAPLGGVTAPPAAATPGGSGTREGPPTPGGAAAAAGTVGPPVRRSRLVHVRRPRGPHAPRRVNRTTAAVAVIIVVLAMLGGSAGVGRGSGAVLPVGFHRPTGSLAACVVGTWRAARYSYDDVWDGVPVLVNQPKTGPITEVSYEADGQMVSVDPAGEQPSEGTLDGAPFLDQRFGTWTGVWTNEADRSISQSVQNTSRWFDLLFTQASATSGPGTFLTVPSAHGRYSPVLTRGTVCTPTTLSFVESYRYHGYTISDNSSYVRLPPGTHLPPGAPVPPTRGLLGGVNLDAYCHNGLGYPEADLTGALVGPGTAFDNWRCGSNSASALDFDNACEWDWQDPVASARPALSDEADSWLCYRSGVPSPASVTLAPTSGGAGTSVTVRSSTGCPAGSYSLGYDLSARRAMAFLIGGGDVRLAPHGPWTISVIIGGYAASQHIAVPPGKVSVYILCYAHNTGPVFVFLPATFDFTGT